MDEPLNTLIGVLWHLCRGGDCCDDGFFFFFKVGLEKTKTPFRLFGVSFWQIPDAVELDGGVLTHVYSKVPSKFHVDYLVTFFRIRYTA